MLEKKEIEGIENADIPYPNKVIFNSKETVPWQDIKRGMCIVYIPSFIKDGIEIAESNIGGGVLLNTVDNTYEGGNQKFYLLTATHLFYDIDPSAHDFIYISFNCENNFPIPSFGTSNKSSAGNSEKEIIADNLLNLDKEDEKKVPDFSIFPNPAKEELNIMVEVQQAGPVQIDIYDMSSRKVFTKSWPNIEQGHHLITLRPLSLSSGNYILHLKSGNVTRVKNLIIKN